MTKYYITEAQHPTNPTVKIPHLVISPNMESALELYNVLNTNDIESINTIAPAQKPISCYYWDEGLNARSKEIPSTDKANAKLFKHSVKLMNEDRELTSSEIGAIGTSIKITLDLFQEILDPKDFSDLIVTITHTTDKELESIRNGRKET